MKTVKVRIAVAVDRNGMWNACGWTGAKNEDMRKMAVDVVGAGDRVFWLEAQLPIPEELVIRADVTEESNVG